MSMLPEEAKICLLYKDAGCKCLKFIGRSKNDDIIRGFLKMDPSKPDINHHERGPVLGPPSNLQTKASVKVRECLAVTNVLR